MNCTEFAFLLPHMLLMAHIGQIVTFCHGLKWESHDVLDMTPFYANIVAIMNLIFERDHEQFNQTAKL